MAMTDDREEYDRDGDASPIEMEAPMGDLSSSKTSDPKAVEEVLYSDIGINVLLQRLKQSIASAREFAGFLKKRSGLEEDHAQGLKKLSAATTTAARRLDARQGTYSVQLTALSQAHDRMGDHGIQFALSLQQMHEDLTELSNNMERGRKHWKTTGTDNEKKVKDAEALMEKAKSRYDSLADDYDRARTGDRSGTRVFTVKGPKSAERHEEDLNRKLQAADADYAAKVQGAQAARQENLNSSRPQAIRALQELIRESDAGLTLQLSKFAAFNEKLLFGNGMVAHPVREDGDQSLSSMSMREMVQHINNERDMQQYITAHSHSVPAKAADIRYEKHPTLAPSQQAPTQQVPPSSNFPQNEDRSVSARQQPSLNTRTQQPATSTPTTQSPRGPMIPAAASLQGSPIAPSSPFANQAGSVQATPERSYRGPSQELPRNHMQPPQPYQEGPPASRSYQTGQAPPQYPTGQQQMQQQPPMREPVQRQMQDAPPPQQYQPPVVPTQRQQPPSGSALPPLNFSPPQSMPINGSYPAAGVTQTARQQQQLPISPISPVQQQQQQQPMAQRFAAPSAPMPGSNGTYTAPNQMPAQQHQQMRPPQAQTQARQPPQAQPAAPQKVTKPVFGVSLDMLFRRDESPVPMVVAQCIQAVEMFGLDTEGIYRLSGNASHISQLKYLFDSGEAARVDFRNPENFQHDVNSVAGLLKQFFKDLPDPLFTSEFYNDFIDAARVDDDVVRRDSLHAVINSLPDPNYATLRAVVLHLNRVQEHSQVNRMSTSNLSICLAPTLMGPHRGPHMADAGLQARVIDTIVQNTFAIFDEE